MKYKKIYLEEVCDISMGQAPSGDSYNNDEKGIPLIAGAGDFTNGKARPSKFTTKPTKICAENDIILGIRASIGEKIWADKTYCLGRGVAGIRANKSEIDPHYLWHWLSSQEKLLLSKARGSTFKQISKKDIYSLRINLPPLDEQRQISKTLDTLSSIEVNMNKKNALIEDLESSFFKNDFEHDIYSVTKEKVTIMDLVIDPKSSIRTGPFGSQLLKSEFKDSGITVLGIDNAVENQFKRTNKRFISIEKYKSLSRFKVNPGDVLITIMGTCGRVCVVPEDIGIAINTKHLCAITLDQNLCLPEFLRAYFLYSKISKTHIKVHTKGAIMDGLNMGIIKSLPIELPSIENQRRFVEKIFYKKRLKEKLDKKFDKFKELKSSISKKLLGV